MLIERTFNIIKTICCQKSEIFQKRDIYPLVAHSTPVDIFVLIFFLQNKIMALSQALRLHITLYKTHFYNAYTNKQTLCRPFAFWTRPGFAGAEDALRDKIMIKKHLALPHYRRLENLPNIISTKMEKNTINSMI